MFMAASDLPVAASHLAQIEALTLRLDASSKAHRFIMDDVNMAVDVLRLVQQAPPPRNLLLGLESSHPQPLEGGGTPTASLIATADRLLRTFDEEHSRIENAITSASSRLQHQSERLDRFRAVSRAVIDIFDPQLDATDGRAPQLSPYIMELRRTLRNHRAKRQQLVRDQANDFIEVCEGRRPLFHMVENSAQPCSTTTSPHVILEQQLEARSAALLRSLQANLQTLRHHRCAVTDAIEQRIECLVDTTT